VKAQISKNKTPRRGSWIVMGGDQDAVAHCMRCNAQLEFRLPLNFTTVIALLNAFRKAHLGCEVAGE
jgi:hypothetical protein